jgi:hypothetical protein
VKLALFFFGDSVAAILERRPVAGPLFKVLGCGHIL